MPHDFNMTPRKVSYKGKADWRTMYFRPVICHNGSWRLDGRPPVEKEWDESLRNFRNDDDDS